MAEHTQQPANLLALNTQRYLRYGVLLVLFVAALWMIIPALWRIQTLLSYAYPHDGLEGTLLFEARLLRSGQPLYQPIELHRFISAPYPPLHYFALALFDLLPGPHVFWGGRMVSVLAALGVALLAALIVRRAGAPWAVSLLAAALVLSIPPLQLWGTRIKPDMLALLFTASGLYCATLAVAPGIKEPKNQRTKEPKKRLSAAAQHSAPVGSDSISVLSVPTLQHSNTRMLLLAMICFVCAFFTKQTAVAGPLATSIALFATDIRDWRKQPGYIGPLPIRWHTLIFSVGYLVLALGIWALLDLLTNHQYTLHVWWGSDRSRWWSFGLFSKIVGLLAFWWPQMVLAIAAVPLSIRRRNLFIPVCYALVAPLTLLGAGETGSHHNHLLETHLALAVAGCAALGVILESAEAQSLRTVSMFPGMAHASLLHIAILSVALLLTGLQVVQTTHPPDWYTGELTPTDPPERFLNFIRNTPGEVLADDTGLLFQAGRDLRYDDPSTMGPAATIGAWDQRGLLEDIEQQKFSAIMLPINIEKSDLDASGRWTPEVLAAIKQHYQMKFHDTISTYVPR